MSYPLSPISKSDFIFSHISSLYWVSLPLLMVSLFLMALTTKNNFFRLILSIGIVLVFFSLSYFYSMMPTADSQQFRAFSENFIQTNSLDASQPNHDYYQWPAFFIISNILTSVAGIQIPNYEFFLYTLIGLLLTATLYIYGTKRYAAGGFLMVIAFFIPLSQLIDYQPVPFSLALAILFLLFLLDTQPHSNARTAAIVLLYASLLITHLFVPLFFVLYLLIKSILERNAQNRRINANFFLLSLVSYFLVEITIAKFSFGQLVRNILAAPPTYSGMISSALSSSSVSSISLIAQFFSRAVTLTFIATCFAGLVLLFIRRKTDIRLL